MIECAGNFGCYTGGVVMWVRKYRVLMVLSMISEKYVFLYFFWV
jgi:hypothetical protein